MELKQQVIVDGMVKQEVEFSGWNECATAMYNLGVLCCYLVKNGQSERNLITAQECVAYLDLDGDYVTYP